MSSALSRADPCAAAQSNDEFLARTGPSQFALQTKGGTDALIHALGLATDLGDNVVVASLGGKGAFDHDASSRVVSCLSASGLHGWSRLCGRGFGRREIDV